MKNIIILLLVLAGTSGWACDVCNCGPGTSLLGFTPVRAKWTIMSTTQWQRFSPLIEDINTYQSSFVQHNFGLLYRVGSWSFQCNVPYRYNPKRQEDNAVSGIGDLVFGAGKEWIIAKKLTLNMGLNAQLPTGSSGDANWYRYPGTGNWRLLYTGNMAFTFSNQQGLVTQVVYDQFISSTGELRIGSSQNVSCAYYKNVQLKQHTLTVMSGFSAYKKEKDGIRGFIQRYSGGSALHWDIQATLSSRKFSGGIGCSAPVVYNINENSVKPLPAVQLQLGYYIM